MRRREQNPGSGYNLLKQVSVFVAIVGVALLLSHLVGQFTVGSAPLASLIGGAACLVLGLLFTMLSVICAKLSRMEHRLSDSTASNEPTEQDQAERESGASGHTVGHEVAKPAGRGDP
ncbi:hypothetical protein LCGC14_2878990 [marine sediment metagenome]|uniref:Uncharacterized protein n=1 Tax=marine sediment metagenome TaxID=412755 RepID=A0A0F9A8T4_9ZZZZ